MAARDISIESGHSDILPSLISAISAGDLTLTTQILNDWKKSPDPNPKRVEKAPFHALQPALETALQKNQLQIAAYFLDQGFHITDTVVECAIEAQSTDGLELLLEHGWAVNNRWAGYKLPSICKAIARDDLSLVSWFLSHGASANLAYTAYTSSTPLSIACASASLPIIQLLVSRGADVKVGNHLHALAECSLPGRVEILDYLVDEGAPVNVLLDVHNPKRFEMSSRWGASPPLHYAVKNGNVEVIRGLLRRGAEKGFRDAKGRTALEVAREEGREEMVGLLSS